MQLNKNRYLFTVVVLALALCTTSCSRSFFIKPQGEFGQPIVFQFYKSENDVQSSKFKIIEFVVQEQVDGSKWVTVWELSGEQSLHAIEYGNQYEYLDEVIVSKPLLRKANYRALASEITWPNPKGYSAVAFSFDENGKLVVNTIN